jgi:hypothetical protein
MPKYEYVNYQNKLYYIYRKIKITQIKEEIVQEIKDYWLCDLVLKYANQDDNSFLFLREITDLEVM